MYDKKINFNGIHRICVSHDSVLLQKLNYPMTITEVLSFRVTWLGGRKIYRLRARRLVRHNATI